MDKIRIDWVKCANFDCDHQPKYDKPGDQRDWEDQCPECGEEGLQLIGEFICLGSNTFMFTRKQVRDVLALGKYVAVDPVKNIPPEAIIVSEE